ncbi:hypothetical protein PC120_g18009 [Phytophthora cactorum]|nr:hypothetical protein PC120_g18009 [Phytophthora cactorum]
MRPLQRYQSSSVHARVDYKAAGRLATGTPYQNRQDRTECFASINTETMTTVLRRAAKAGNINPQKISTHSLRSGGATAMHTAGVDADTIRMHGRWASDAYRAYVHEAPAAVLHLAKRMGTTSSTPTRTDQEHGASRAQELV